jgi:hypothetical protein
VNIDTPSTTTRATSVVETLCNTGVLDAFVPEKYGGVPQTVAFLARRITQVSGWNTAAGLLAARTAVNNFAVSELSPTVQDEVWGTDDHALIGGAANLSGTFARAGDNVVITWSPAAERDSLDANWLLATVTEPGSTTRFDVLLSVDEVRSAEHGAHDSRRDVDVTEFCLETAVVPPSRIWKSSPIAADGPLNFLTTLLLAASIVGTARGVCLEVSKILDGPPYARGSIWGRPERTMAYASAIRRMDRAEAFLEGALAKTGTHFSPNALGPESRSRASDLASSAVESSKSVIPWLIRSIGAAPATPTHWLEKEQYSIVTRAGDPAFAAVAAARDRQQSLLHHLPDPEPGAELFGDA